MCAPFTSNSERSLLAQNATKPSSEILSDETHLFAQIVEGAYPRGGVGYLLAPSFLVQTFDDEGFVWSGFRSSIARSAVLRTYYRHSGGSGGR